jgi:hypothetical protein
MFSQPPGSSAAVSQEGWLVLRLISLAIEALQEHETRTEEHGAECREQLGAPSSWLAGGPAQPSQPTRFSKDEGPLA